MIEQTDKKISKPRKFRCSHYWTSEMFDMDSFITNVIGSNPKKYEIISLVRNERANLYELFYKEYLS
jgi:hypothetical protein